MASGRKFTCKDCSTKNLVWAVVVGLWIVGKWEGDKFIPHNCQKVLSKT